MSYRPYAPDDGGFLPKDGERLEFGVHRMPYEDRTCPMWPKNPDAAAQTRFSTWRRGAAKGNPSVIALLARVKAGEVRPADAATIIVRNTRPMTLPSPDAVREAAINEWVRRSVARHEDAA